MFCRRMSFLSKDFCFVEGCLFCRKMSALSKDVCLFLGCKPVPRVQACSSRASLFLACKPVPRVQACSSRASLLLGCKPVPRCQNDTKNLTCSLFLVGKTHSARGGNRTGYRPVPTRPRAAGSTTLLVPPQSPAFSVASYAQQIQALGEQCASIVVRPEKHNFLQNSTPNILKRNFFVVL